MKVLIIENTVDIAERIATHFDFGSNCAIKFTKDRSVAFGSNCEINIANNRTAALGFLEKNSYDVIFLDVYLNGNRTLDIHIILEEIFKTDRNHGAVFILSKIANFHEDAFTLKQELNEYPILALSTPLLDDDAEEPKEYKNIKHIIRIIRGSIDRHSQPKISYKDEVGKFLIFLIVWLTNLPVLVFVLTKNLLPNIQPTMQISISLAPAILVTVILYMEKLKILIDKFIKK
jgi:CheY-like chemotaxis protein